MTIEKNIDRLSRQKLYVQVSEIIDLPDAFLRSYPAQGGEKYLQDGTETNRLTQHHASKGGSTQWVFSDACMTIFRRRPWRTPNGTTKSP